MFLSGLEAQSLLASLAVLLDNCSSLFDCWSTLGAAAAAAVGAGAAAVFVGGLLLNPGETAGIVEEAPPVAPSVGASPPATFEGGATTTVAQAPPQAPTQAQPAMQPQQFQPYAQPQVQPGFEPQVQPQMQPQMQPSAQPQIQPQASPPAAQPMAPEPVAAVQPGPVEAAIPPGPAAPDVAVGASPPSAATPAPPPPAAPAALVAPDAPASPPPVTPVELPQVDPALAAGLAAGVAPLVGTVAAAGSRASSSGTSRDSGSQGEEDQDEDEVTCPEADASLFGLPDINTRQDCPGTRSGMPPNFAGLDFTSNDDYGRPTELPFEAGVTGEVTYVGGAFNTVQVTLENGNRIQFLHASRVLVQPGQQVEPTTVLGRTGGTGPYGPNQYEIHLHVQAFDRHGDLIDPDCALSGGENRRLRRRVIPPETPTQPQATPGATAVLTGTQPFAPGEVPQVPVQPPMQAPPPPPQTAPPLTPQIAPQVPPQVMPPAAAEMRCTRCGNLSPPNSLFCAWCGQTFVQAAAPAQAAPPVAPPPSAPPQLIYCGNCGQANTWGSAFCGRCGSRLSY